MFIRRIGLFFLIMGLLILLVSIASGKPNSQSLTLFCIGVPLVMFGWTLWYRNRERTPSQRFRTLRKFSTKEDVEDNDDE
jgi:membrane protein implicated in regulation of membrane protease activity